MKPQPILITIALPEKIGHNWYRPIIHQIVNAEQVSDTLYIYPISRASWSITHGPTGMNVVHCASRDKAVKVARLFAPVLDLVTVDITGEPYNPILSAAACVVKQQAHDLELI